MTAKAWNGTAWVDGTPKVWNGTSWVPGVARVWDGANWVPGDAPPPDPPALLHDFGFENTASSGTTVTATVPTGGIPAGALVVVGGACISAGDPEFTVDDDAGNTYTTSFDTVAALTTRGIVAVTIVTDPLDAGDTITITSTANMSRSVITVAAFTGTFAAPAIGSWNDTSDPTLTAGTVSVSEPTLLVGCAVLSNPGRTVTELSGWTQATKRWSAVGSGDRAVAVVWRTASSGSHAQFADLNSSGTSSAAIAYAAFS